MVLINLTKMAHNEDGPHHVHVRDARGQSVSQTRAARRGPTYMCNSTLTYDAGQRAEFEAFETFTAV